MRFATAPGARGFRAGREPARPACDGPQRRASPAPAGDGRGRGRRRRAPPARDLAFGRVARDVHGRKLHRERGDLAGRAPGGDGRRRRARADLGRGHLHASRVLRRAPLQGQLGRVFARRADPRGVRRRRDDLDLGREDGRTLMTLSKPRCATRCIAFSPEGGTIAACGWEGAIRLFDPATGLETSLFREGACPVRALAFTPDGDDPGGGFGRRRGLDLGRGRASGTAANPRRQGPDPLPGHLP